MKKNFPWIAGALVLIGGLYFGYGLFFSQGSANGKSKGKVESKTRLPAPENIVTDDETGLKVEKNVILVTFSRYADEDTVNEVVKYVGGEILGFELDSNFYQIKLPGAELKKSKEVCLTILGKFKEVEFAVPNTVSKADNPYWDSDR